MNRMTCGCRLSAKINTKIKICRWVIVSLLLINLSGTRAAETRPADKLHEHPGPFVLADPDGKTYSSKELLSAKLLVVAFLGTECPLAKHYSVRLQTLSEKWAADGIQVVGVMSNQQDSLSDIRAFQEQHALRFPLLQDSRNRVADQFGAERTPEVFVLDQTGAVRYRGRIDDQYQIGVQRDHPANEDLKAAIEALLSGKSPAVSRTEAIGCVIGREKVSQPDSAVTYSNQIIRLFQKRCIDCHREGQAAPFVLTNYSEAKGWASMIEEVVRNDRMPPWHADPSIGEFRNDCHLEDEEKEWIFSWVAAGAPEGNRQDLPAAKEYASDWLLPHKPDHIVSVTKEPVTIPAQGTIKYRYFVVDPGFTEDKWIQGAELRPGNYAVVHHILVFVRPKGQRGGLADAENGGFLAAYVPGLVPDVYPAGMAKKLSANSELVFQMHYTSTGSPQEDISQLGLIFADPEKVTHQVVTGSANSRHLKIPAHAENYRTTGVSPRSDREVLLLSLMPHMHLRGKSFDYELHTPDGKKTPLLSVPRYDFNWQTTYRLREPLIIPAGSRIKGIAHFDNSSKNPHNPDPSAVVTWGEQTWEEMMIGYFDVAIPLQQESSATVPLADRAEQLLNHLDQNGDGELERSEIPEKWLSLFPLIDRNRNGRISLDELEKALNKLQR